MKVLYSWTWIESEDQGIYSIRSLYKTQTFTIYLLLKVFLNVLYGAKWLQARSFSCQCLKASHSTTTNRGPSIFFFSLLMQISQLEFLSIPFLATIEASETWVVSFLVTLCSMGACDWLERELNNPGFTHYLEITQHFRIMSASVFCRYWVWIGEGRKMLSHQSAWRVSMETWVHCPSTYVKAGCSSTGEGEAGEFPGLVSQSSPFVSSRFSDRGNGRGGNRMIV